MPVCLEPRNSRKKGWPLNIAKTIYSTVEYDVVYTPDITYAHRDTGDLTLQIVSPVAPSFPVEPPAHLNPVQAKFARWHRTLGDKADSEPQPQKAQRAPEFPLIVDCPGSGWAGADGHRHVPYLVHLAQAGFVAASVSYRGTYRDNVVFPAAVQDLKEAVRYLCSHADVFHIDTDRVGLLGDSSGGNTAAMAALAGDHDTLLDMPDRSFAFGACLSEAVQAKACCCVYGPVDLIHLVEDRIAENKPLRPDEEPGLPFEAMEIWQDTYLSDPAKYLRAASPLYYIERAKTLPPFLYVIGDEDPIIPVAQGLRFCDALRARGGKAELIKVAGAGHGNGVWGSEMLQEVIRFFKAYL